MKSVDQGPIQGLEAVDEQERVDRIQLEECGATKPIQKKGILMTAWRMTYADSAGYDRFMPTSWLGSSRSRREQQESVVGRHLIVMLDDHCGASAVAEARNDDD